MLGKCSAMNIDNRTVFALEHGIGGWEMWWLHELGSEGKRRKLNEGMVDLNDCISGRFK